MMSLGYYTGANEFPVAAPSSKQLDSVSPFLLGGHKPGVSDLDLEHPHSPRRRRSIKGPTSKRLSGRPALTSSPDLRSATVQSNTEAQDRSGIHHEQREGHRHVEHLIDQVSEWIRHERNKRAGREGKHPPTDGIVESRERGPESDQADTSDPRRGSDVSEGSFDLTKLEVCTTTPYAGSLLLMCRF